MFLRRQNYAVDKPLTHENLWRQLPIVERGQIIRAVLFGLLFAAVFLWAMPQYRLVFADGDAGHGSLTQRALNQRALDGAKMSDRDG